MKKPSILLSGKKKIEYYVDAVEGVGGIATAGYLPAVDTSYDGLIICGGSDMHPSYFGEPINGSVKIDIERDKVEFALLEAYVKAGKPVLGICRGMQIINVFFGGGMYQHIPNAAEHTSPDCDLVHTVTAVEGSRLASLYGTSFAVNSHHHQAVSTIGKGLAVVARTDDGTVVEAVEHTSLPILGVQWHPERMCFSQRREDAVDGAALFQQFVDFCK